MNVNYHQVTGSLPGQTGAAANGMTIFSPVTSLAGAPSGSFAGGGTSHPTSQLLMQPVQHITLTTITPGELIRHRDLPSLTTIIPGELTRHRDLPSLTTITPGELTRHCDLPLLTASFLW